MTHHNGTTNIRQRSLNIRTKAEYEELNSELLNVVIISRTIQQILDIGNWNKIDYARHYSLTFPLGEDHPTTYIPRVCPYPKFVHIWNGLRPEHKYFIISMQIDLFFQRN